MPVTSQLPKQVGYESRKCCCDAQSMSFKNGSHQRSFIGSDVIININMKKKPERYSFKKLAVASKKLQAKYNEEMRLTFDKPRSQPKNRSAERALDGLHKFKINKAGHVDRDRFKTQTDEYVSNNKNPYHKPITLKKPREEKADKFDKLKLKDDKNRHYYDSKAKNVKKLHLNSDLFGVIKNHSLEKYETPQSGKHHSFRKAHDSSRAANKKTALQRYISDSLQNLDCPKSKGKNSLGKQAHRNTIKRKGDETIFKQKRTKEHHRVFQDTTKGVKDQKLQKMQNEHIKTEKDDSLQKIQIKWEKKKRNPHELSREEQETFGDRFPDGFDKIKLLGRGGFSLVWLGEHKKSKKKYAVKQIITESSHQTHIKEIWFGTYFFDFGGAPKQEFAGVVGIKNLVRLYYYFINKKDTWILYEKCGDSLGNALYELKSDYWNNEKVYRIIYKQFYNKMRVDQLQLRKIILEVAQALQLLSENNIVHSDLKTQNILIKLKSQENGGHQPKNPAGTSQISQVKLIDYGSSFVFNNLRQFSMATPEYMAPEILNFILYENQFEYIPKLLDYVQQYNNPWVIDVWSLGSVLLEIVSGIPLWMSLKTIVKRKSVESIKYGLFAIKGRSFEKIIRKQLEVVQNLDHYLYEENYSGIVLEDDLKTLLKRMLALNPAKRISPSEIIQFLTPKVAETC